MTPADSRKSSVVMSMEHSGPGERENQWRTHVLARPGESCVAKGLAGPSLT
jgi:hypothetical protein